MLYNMKQKRNYGHEHQWHQTRDMILIMLIGIGTIGFGAYGAVYTDQKPEHLLVMFIGFTSVLIGVTNGRD